MKRPMDVLLFHAGLYLRLDMIILLVKEYRIMDYGGFFVYAALCGRLPILEFLHIECGQNYTKGQLTNLLFKLISEWKCGKPEIRESLVEYGAEMNDETIVLYKLSQRRREKWENFSSL